jgi:hypothetical protein
MTPAKQARDAEHNDLVNLSIYEVDICADIDCYFDPDTNNLWHAYVGDHDIFNIMRDSTIAFLEREFEKHCGQEREQSRTDAAIDRYESRMLDHVMNRLQWQPSLDALRIR